jgi:hypothetical protein
MCCPKASSRCVTLASLRPAAANACERYAYSSSTIIPRTSGSQKLHQNQQRQRLNQNCAVQTVDRPCFFSASFNPRGAAHHELSGFSAPTFLLDAGFHACTRVSARLIPENIHPNSGFQLALGGILVVQLIQTYQLDGGLDLTVCLKSQMVRHVS